MFCDIQALLCTVPITAMTTLSMEKEITNRFYVIEEGSMLRAYPLNVLGYISFWLPINHGALTVLARYTDAGNDVTSTMA